MPYAHLPIDQRPVVIEYKPFPSSDHAERMGIYDEWQVMVSTVEYRENGTAYKFILDVEAHKSKRVLRNYVRTYKDRVVDKLDMTDAQITLF